MASVANLKFTMLYALSVFTGIILNIYVHVYLIYCGTYILPISVIIDIVTKNVIRKKPMDILLHWQIKVRHGLVLFRPTGI